MKKGNSRPYTSKPEPLFLVGKEVLRFEIFAKYFVEIKIGEEKASTQVQEFIEIEELIADEKPEEEGEDATIEKDVVVEKHTSKEDITAEKDTEDKVVAVDLETFIQNSIVDVFL